MVAEAFPEFLETLPVKDHRLIPRVPLERVGDFHKKDGRIMPLYAITEATHPELIATLEAALAGAGIQGKHKIFMYGDGSGQEKEASYVTGRLRIGDGFFIHGSLEVLKHVISHEIGHERRDARPLASGPIPESSTHPPHYKAEIEADLISVCLTLDREGGIQMMSNTDIRPTGVPIDSKMLEARKEAMQNLDLSRCGEWVEWNPNEPVTATTKLVPNPPTLGKR
jgi:hypothetical protein